MKVCGVCPLRQKILVTALVKIIAAKYMTGHNALIVSRFQGDDIFLAFPPTGIYYFLKNGYNQSIFLAPPSLHFPNPSRRSFYAGTHFAMLFLRLMSENI